jgi:hypothetical protein
LNGEVFTPALIVNGAAMIVGSDEQAVHQAIGQAAPPPVGVTLRHSDAALEAEIGVTAAHVTGTLVTYDPEQSTQIGAGENQGRRLVEYRVARDAIMLERLGSRLTLPAIPANRGAVLLIQDQSWRVVGAADLPPYKAV